METWRVVGGREGLRGPGEALERLWSGSRPLSTLPGGEAPTSRFMQEVLRPRMQPCSTRKLKNFEFRQVLHYR
jgi:hypothetical protein